jgi:hypothetical protein
MPFPYNLKVELTPRRIEAELAAYLHRWFDYAVRSKIFTLDWRAQEALEHVISRAFLAGKIQASRETRTPWQIIGDDSEQIEQLAKRFKADFEKIMQDLRYEIIFQGPPTPRTMILRRFDALAQMLTWKAYNLGKRSEFIHSLRQAALFMGATYKYAGYFMFQTKADEKVCEWCAPLSGTLYPDYDTLINTIQATLPANLSAEPPVHINCRCEIVSTPTVPTFEKQWRFVESWTEEQKQEAA